MPAPLSEVEAIAFSERLDAFGNALSRNQLAFLTTILTDAEADWDGDYEGLDHTPNRTPGEIAIAIYHNKISPPISLNPQPVPLQAGISSVTCPANEP